MKLVYIEENKKNVLNYIADNKFEEQDTYFTKILMVFIKVIKWNKYLLEYCYRNRLCMLYLFI